MATDDQATIQQAGSETESALNSLLIQTRLHIPPLRAKHIQRPRLFSSLEQALERKLILLSAPAGYGKTTLLSAWARRTSWPVAWFSLDRGDNDRTRFFTYLLSALQRIQPQVGQITSGLLAARQAPSNEQLLTPLLNELLLVPHMALVLDDYQSIEEQSIHEALTFLLEYLPESLRLIIATRTDPPLPLARLRARHQLQELRTNELRFSREESVAFLTESMDLSLQEEVIVALDERNQGWITGLQLAALSLQGHSHQPDHHLAEIHHFVFDYLAEEVMQQLSPSLQTFLLQTSVLTHLYPALCDAVTGQGSGQHQLVLLEKNNLFLMPLDAEQNWYRYHPLFAEFLRKRLRQHNSAIIPDLLERASLWCEQHRFLDEAIEYALAAELDGRAAQLIARHARTLLTKRELSTLLRWIEKLPADIVQVQPQLCISYCWALLFTFQVERIGPLLQQAESVLDDMSDREGQTALRGEIAAIQATQASLRGDLEQTIVLTARALSDLPPEDLWTRGTLVFFQGVAYYVTGDMLKARQSYQEALSLNRSAGNHSLALLAHCYLARLLMTVGQLRDALQMLETARAQARERDSLFSLAGGILAVELGNIYYEQNEMERAYAELTRSIEIGKMLASADLLRAGFLALARWQQARGQMEAARGLLGQVDEVKQSASVLWVEAEIQAYRLQWEASQHRAKEMEYYRIVELEREEGPTITLLTEITYLARVRALIISGSMNAALGLLEKLLRHAEDEQRTGSIIKIRILQAKIFFLRGDSVPGLKAIQRALTLAAPERYMRVFLDEGEPIKVALQHAAAHGIQSPYTLQILRAFSEAVPHVFQAQPLLDPLSERELEVLQCIRSGLSNQAIADHLQVSLNTVKTHLSHIFAKLHVNSRTQAVARANELGIMKE
jgi:LuxR family maltose regulon positive regulatory protein